MRIIIFSFILSLIVSDMRGQEPQHQGEYVLVIHGGAGTILKSGMTPEKEKAYRSGLEQA